MGWMTLTLKPCIDHGTCMFSRLLVLDHGVDSIQVTAVTTITNCFFRNIWIVTGELLDAFPARDDQNHPVTHVCVCKGMRGLYTILMDRHCFCWRRLDDGSLSVETSPWLLSFIDLIYVNHKSCAFQKKLTLFLLVVLVLCVSSPSQICCTVYPLFRCVCWWNPYVSWLSPMWVLWVDVRICVGYQRPMFVNGLLNISFLLSWLTSNFSCFSSTSRFPEMKETSAANPNVYL